MSWRYLSALPGAAWPAIPAIEEAPVLALFYQLQHTQWLSAEALQERQASQLQGLLRHAWETVPFYRRHWGAPPDTLAFSQLPLLTRRAVQENYEALKSRAYPAEHGPASESRTSGSTGMPVRVLKTALNEAIWRAIGLREHAWQRRDLGGRLAAVRALVKAGRYPDWGAVTGGLVRTGESAMLDVTSSVDEQLDWLRELDPDYLLTYPSNAAELARGARRRGLRLSRLRELRTMGEVFAQETRALCTEVFAVPLTDAYSTDETGYLALQCPGHEHYHVQAEAVLLEVLNDRNQACPPGETGRVVVTSLHNFAAPLIRYDLGDYAEVGSPCACGRGLPVLRRIAGRVRNMLVAPDGARYWPILGLRDLPELAQLVQYQVVQTARDLVRVRLVTRAPLGAAGEALLLERMGRRLPAGIRIEITYVDRIERRPGGKFEEFISEVA